MATSFVNIYDLFLSKVQDYRLAELYKISEEDLNHKLEPYLLFSVDRFSHFCSTNIVDALDIDGETFSVDLSFADKMILANLMLEFWMQQVTNNILQMDGKLKDTDFTTYSEAQNLKAKQDYLATIKEENSQLLVNYQLTHKVSWRDWASGRYYNGI